jgi:hypothetical protein
MKPVVNKWLDLLDRVGWTAIQASAAAAVVFLTNGTDFDWQVLLSFVGTATAIAVLKVVIGQNTGTDNTGSLIGQPVIEPPPTSNP